MNWPWRRRRTPVKEEVLDPVEQAIMDAYDLIRDRDRWCNDEALDAAGEWVSCGSPKAVRWCVGGALLKVAPTRAVAEAAALRLAGGHDVFEAVRKLVHANDVGHAAVIGLFSHHYNWTPA